MATDRRPGRTGPVTEAPTLRPLGVGDIVDRVFTLYRARPLLFLTLAAIPYLTLALALGALAIPFAPTFIALAPLLSAAEPPAIDRVVDAAIGVGSFLLIAVLVAIVVFAVQSAALVDAAAARYLGREATVGASFRAGLGVSGRLVLAGIAVFVALIAVPMALIIGAALTGAALVVIAAALAALAAFFYLVASWMVVPVVVTLEPVGPIAALRRSWSLSSGSRWRVLGLVALLTVLQVVLTTLFSFVFLSAFVADDLVRTVLQQAANLAASIAWAPVQWGTFTLLYYDLRVRKEALDLQLAAEALPREP